MNQSKVKNESGMKATWKAPHPAEHGQLVAAQVNHLPETAFAFPRSRKEPITDASHVRNAIARFDQVEDVSDEERDLAFANIKEASANRVVRQTDRAGVSQPAVSKHLGVLKHARLVRDRREGRETHYSVQPQALAPLIDWMSLYGAFWRRRFDRLESLLKRMD